MPTWTTARLATFFIGLGLIVGPAYAAPTSVTITGDLQSELGCAGDYNPACAATAMTYSANSDVWRFAAPSIPGGNWSYFAALNGGLTEVYGPNGAPSAIPPASLLLAAPTAVTFYYDDKSHWVTDNINAVIATAVGDFQSELGCAGDFDPACLRSWLQDVDGDGTYQFRTTALPAGNYNALAALNETFNEVYGLNGTPPQGGNPAPSIPFTVPEAGAPMLFTYTPETHVLTITVERAPPDTDVPEPGTVALLLAGLLGLAATRFPARSAAMCRHPAQ